MVSSADGKTQSQEVASQENAASASEPDTELQEEIEAGNKDEAEIEYDKSYEFDCFFCRSRLVYWNSDQGK